MVSVNVNNFIQLIWKAASRCKLVSLAEFFVYSSGEGKWESD